MELSEANEMNVPVNIFISGPEDGDSGEWELSADNFMPREAYITNSMYYYTAQNRWELEELVNTYIIPLYEAALKNLYLHKELYYWETKK